MPDQALPLQQLAQGTPDAPPAGTGPEGHSETGATTTHAEQGHHEYKLGDIPGPHLLFANAILVCLVLLAFGFAARRNLKQVPGKVWSLQNFGEFIVESMTNFVRGIIGPGGEKYVPLVGTLFLFIYIGNLWGQVPVLHSPTANLSTTLALGLIVFVYVQFIGIKNNGLRGYLSHFAGPKLEPLALRIPIVILLFPIEIISELVKPFTLAMRLFGNIFGEDTVIIVLSMLGVTMLSPVVPMQFPILILAILTTFVQALVFTLLTCIYISLQSHHDEGHEEGHGQEHPAPAHSH